jgi:hypothetical protein
MAGEVVRLDARRGRPGIGPEIPDEDDDSMSSTWVGGVKNPFFEWGAPSLAGERMGDVGVEYGILLWIGC